MGPIISRDMKLYTDINFYLHAFTKQESLNKAL